MGSTLSRELSEVEKPMPQGGIDKHAITKMMKYIQREFNKHPIRVPLHRSRSTS